MIKILAAALGLAFPSSAFADNVACSQYTQYYKEASSSQDRLKNLLSQEFEPITSFTMGAFLALGSVDFSSTPDIEKAQSMVSLYHYCMAHPGDNVFDAAIQSAREKYSKSGSGKSIASTGEAKDAATPPIKSFADMFSPDVMDAIAKLRMVSQKLELSGSFPAVLFQIRNESDRAFSMLSIECGVMKGDTVVASAEGFIMNLQPGQTASSEANFILTKEALDADHAVCRAGMGL